MPLNEFLTPLGLIKTWVQSESLANESFENDYQSVTVGHKIMLKTFEPKNEWLPNDMFCESAIGWRWYMEKTNDLKEDLIIYCQLLDPKADLEFSANSGEHLDAIMIENQDYELHIGTEDTDAFWMRSVKDDWMPKRFENELGLHRDKRLDYTEYIDFGFKTTVPKLLPGERIYFHYLVATNPIKQSLQFPDERDVSTWYAVEKSKKFLDERLV